MECRTHHILVGRHHRFHLLKLLSPRVPGNKIQRIRGKAPLGTCPPINQGLRNSLSPSVFNAQVQSGEGSSSARGRCGAPFERRVGRLVLGVRDACQLPLRPAVRPAHSRVARAERVAAARSVHAHAALCAPRGSRRRGAGGSPAGGRSSAPCFAAWCPLRAAACACGYLAGAARVARARGEAVSDIRALLRACGP